MARPRTSKSTIRNDPFAGVIPVPDTAPEAARGNEPRPPARATEVAAKAAANIDQPPAADPKRPEPPTPAPAAVHGGGRQKLTVHLEGELVNRVKNAAYWNPRLTIARIAEQGIRKALEGVERQNGGPYPQRESALVGGRHIK